MRTDGLTDTTKLIVAIQNLANAPTGNFKALVKNPLKPNPEGACHQAMQFKGSQSVLTAVNKS